MKLRRWVQVVSKTPSTSFRSGIIRVEQQERAPALEYIKGSEDLGNTTLEANGNDPVPNARGG